MWVAGDREIPGPVAAFLHLFESLPAPLRYQAITRSLGEPEMIEGMYEVKFVGSDGDGLGVIVLMDGRVVGCDGGVDYDGTYQPTGLDNRVKAEIQCKVRPGAELVTGVPAQSTPYSFGITVEFPARGAASGQVMTPFGPVNVSMTYLRELN
jgi:hypothetical protein